MPLIPRMRARRRGRVVFISSIAALAPLPDAAAYSASKAALLAYELAKRERLRAEGIKVNLVFPGFVTTPMAGHHLGWKPLRFHRKTRRGASCAGCNTIARSLPIPGRSYGLALLADAARAVASGRIERIPLPHCAAGMKLRLIRRHRRGWSKRLCALVRWPSSTPVIVQTFESRVPPLRSPPVSRHAAIVRRGAGRRAGRVRRLRKRTAPSEIHPPARRRKAAA
jgi:short subunit dehydrogenase